MGREVQGNTLSDGIDGKAPRALQSADKHFTFQYELPKWPLQKRKAKTTNAYTRKQVRGSAMPFVHTPASRKLEADVQELNEFLHGSRSKAAFIRATSASSRTAMRLASTGTTAAGSTVSRLPPITSR